MELLEPRKYRSTALNQPTVVVRVGDEVHSEVGPAWGSKGGRRRGVCKGGRRSVVSAIRPSPAARSAAAGL
jgi:hypothetical protein